MKYKDGFMRVKAIFKIHKENGLNMDTEKLMFC